MKKSPKIKNIHILCIRQLCIRTLMLSCFRQSNVYKNDIGGLKDAR